jgi:hypothetical protein
MRNEHHTTTAQPPLSPPAIAALHKGNKIAGIKIVRQELNIGLKEAKDAWSDTPRVSHLCNPPLPLSRAKSNDASCFGSPQSSD